MSLPSPPMANGHHHHHAQHEQDHLPPNLIAEYCCIDDTDAANAAATDIILVNNSYDEPDNVTTTSHDTLDQDAPLHDDHSEVHDLEQQDESLPPIAAGHESSLLAPPASKPSVQVPHHLKKRVRNEYYRIRQMKRHKRSDVVKVSLRASIKCVRSPIILPSYSSCRQRTRTTVTSWTGCNRSWSSNRASRTAFRLTIQRTVLSCERYEHREKEERDTRAYHQPHKSAIV